MLTRTDFTGLREEVGAGVPLPDLAAIHRRGRARRRLRQTGWVSAPAVLVVLILVAAGLLTERQGENEIAAWRPPAGVPPVLPAPVRGDRQGSAVSVTQRLQVLTIKTPDEWRSFALVRTPSKSLATARTLDGGRSWQAWTVPGVTAFKSFRVLSGQTLVLDRLVSRDGGRTWTPLPGHGSPVQQAPAGWDVRASGSDITATDPATGIEIPLARQPGYVDNWHDVREATDGSLWAVARPPGSDTSVPVVSRDRGRSWTVARGIRMAVTGVDSLDGRVGYALGEERSESGVRGVVMVTRDGGNSWATVNANALTGQPNGMPGFSNPTVLADGSLVALRADGLYRVVRSTDGGRSFADVDAPGWLLGLDRSSSGGLVGTVTDSSARFVDRPPAIRILSQDGLHWTRGAEPPNAYRVPGAGTPY